MSDTHGDEKQINEEYKIWKKNTPLLYDVVLSHALEWPSLTIQWLPGKKSLPDKEHIEYRILLGTHTSEGDQNHLMLAHVHLPSEEALQQSNTRQGEATRARVFVSQRINHQGEVHRARHMPQHPTVIATKSPTPSVYIFCYDKHPARPTDNQASPDLTLQGHTKEGYGLSWNQKKAGSLLSGSDDHVICLWDDIEHTIAKDSKLEAAKFTGHSQIVEDVAWSPLSETEFGSVGDDHKLMLWDTRDKDRNKARHTITAHTTDINCLAFSNHCDHLLVTGAADGSVALWDTRNLSLPAHAFPAHNNQVYGVHFSPTSPTVLASSSADRKVHIWDIGRIGAEQDPIDAEDGPPELLFVHSGHTSSVSDMAWSATEHMMMASTAEDNIIQIWQMAENIYREDHSPPDASLLE